MSYSRQPSSKNLVMGFATNQSEKSIRIFCQSLRTVYSPEECDIAIIVNRCEEYFRELARFGVQFVSTPNNYSATTSRGAKIANRLVLRSLRFLNWLGLRRWLPEIAASYPILLETWHHPLLARWFACCRVLSINQIYKDVCITDVKDVFFQAPFFDSSSATVNLFEDVDPYGRCYWNDKWYRGAFGETAFARVLGRQPVCAGTIFGDQPAMLSMLQEFTGFIARSPFGRIDQAIFNHMVLTHMFKTKCDIKPNIAGQVATLGSGHAHQSIKIADDAICRAGDGGVIPIVHMYDRWPDTDALCVRKYLTREQVEPQVCK